MTKYISELFKEFEKLKTKREKLGFLWDHKKNGIFTAILQGAFDPNIKWHITDIPKYTPDIAPLGLNPSSLLNVIPKCTIFAIGHPKSAGVKKKRMTELLIQVLESMHEDESNLYVGMLKKKLKVKGLTESMVLEVFPDLYRKV